MANQQNMQSNSKQQTRTLPKNFRQIGDPGTKKIYLEDYVYTYLNKLAQPGNLYARGAILFGNVYRTSAGACLFISGAAACQNFEFDLDESVFTEENWNEIYRVRDRFFPGQEIVGWFLSRMGFSVELNDKIIRTHMDHFSGENKVLFMIDALENEDAFYQFENYSLKKQRGYYIYYETNKEMKEYMLAEGEMEENPEKKRKSTTILRDASVVKNYKKAMQQKKSLRKKAAPRFGPASLAGVLVMIMVLFYGARSVQQFRQEENAEAVFQQETLQESVQKTAEEETFSGQDTTKRGEASSEQGTTKRGETSSEQDMADRGKASSEQDMADRGGTYSSQDMTTDGREASSGQDVTNEGEDFPKQNTTKREETSLKNDTADQEGSAADEDSLETGADIFTQEEPDDVTESWSYIGNQYTVRPGDTLAGISMKIYESYDYIESLAEANGITNMDEIYPGQILEIPPMED